MDRESFELRARPTTVLGDVTSTNNLELPVSPVPEPTWQAQLKGEVQKSKHKRWRRGQCCNLPFTRAGIIPLIDASYPVKLDIEQPAALSSISISSHGRHSPPSLARA
ncbi:hypothetical protein VE03_02135 [Pseudogymnoascus sp. 23342-1-I1]|nr:hypothetical protein VE03_02135 [Pseudogymnoascus sp. 23342-1-I1]